MTVASALSRTGIATAIAVILAFASAGAGNAQTPDNGLAERKARAEISCRANAGGLKFESCVMIRSMTLDQLKAYQRALLDLQFGDAASWASERVEVGDWVVAAATSEFVVLTKAAGSASRPRTWVRTEYKSPQSGLNFPHQSLLILVEFDCPESRFRQLQIDASRENNNKGQSDSHTVETPQWTYPRPNTMLETAMKKACAAALR